MKIYISGPMSNLPDLNRSAFSYATDVLLARGHTPCNPTTTQSPLSDSQLADMSPAELWLHYMRLDIARLLDCDAIYMLHNWRRSRGAKLERCIAKRLGLIMFYQDKRPFGERRG